MTEPLIKGLIVSVTDDLGPKAIINISKLSNDLANELSMIGMTTLLFGNPNRVNLSNRFFKVLGPLPVPFDENHLNQIGLKDDFEDTIAVIFNVKNDLPTTDSRVIKFGREVIIWFIFNSSDGFKILRNTKIIEFICQDYINKIKNESQLNDEPFFMSLLKEIREKITDMTNNDENQITNLDNKQILGYSLYKYNFDLEKISPIHDIREIKDLDNLIIINPIEKKISVLELKKLNDRKSFLLNKAISNLNLTLKRKYFIRIVNDTNEIFFFLKKIHENSISVIQ